jgi:hypothetical protein
LLKNGEEPLIKTFYKGSISSHIIVSYTKNRKVKEIYHHPLGMIGVAATAERDRLDFYGIYYHSLGTIERADIKKQVG